jgi:hypothetical protein
MSELSTSNHPDGGMVGGRDDVRAIAEQFGREMRASLNSMERHIMLLNVPWSTYVVLRNTLDGSGVRLTYLKGSLEIVTPSYTNKVEKKQIARLFELFCLERGIPLYAHGWRTCHREGKARGLEADEYYCRDRDHEVPDVALEMRTTIPLLDKLEVYRGLGVREVWGYRFGGRFDIRALHGKRYERVEMSGIFPEVDLAAIARYGAKPDQHAALCAFRDELRAR